MVDETLPALARWSTSGTAGLLGGCRGMLTSIDSLGCPVGLSSLCGTSQSGCPLEHRSRRLRQIAFRDLFSERLVLCNPELAAALDQVPEVHAWAPTAPALYPREPCPPLLKWQRQASVSG